MPYIKMRDGEPFDRAFRRFTKACEKCGLMAEIRKHQRFVKPSEAKKRKSAAARRKIRKLIRLARTFGN
ncbi:MAG: 30S ribosomal protein S21 [Calditrichaeota bacterium]|jgi:small subunit ribosomal protein S21|nr:30S ribosomal protein S21 [Calditrichota bacterium]MBT7617113.1 30S ribosomal protein S21 [Calditrichota bacterium]MBT7787590.1 30S ribosomal protein S21 [Calditrichota bacterium]NQU65650.1 30S ribosomal protein S21 [SAR324 cluster bacterium]